MAYEGLTLNIKIEFETIECFRCHVLFAVESMTRKHYIDTGDYFYCPNGHRQYYTESTIQKLEKQLETKQRALDHKQKELEWSEQRTRNVKNSLKAEKGAKTKLKKRIANGVCPCCQRPFVNLARHMKGQHPNYAKQGAL